MEFKPIHKLKENLALTNYFVVPQNIAYYLLLSPFKFKATSSSIIIEQHFIRTLLWGLVTTLGVLYRIYALYLTYFSGEGLHNIFRLFKFVRSVTDTFRRLYVIKILWLDQRKFEELINYFNLIPKSLASTNSILANPLIIRVLVVIHYIFALLTLFHENLHKFQNFSRCLVNELNICRFLNTLCIIPLVNDYDYAHFATSDMFLFIPLFSMWTLSKSFAKFLQKHTGSCFEEKNFYLV